MLILEFIEINENSKNISQRIYRFTQIFLLNGSLADFTREPEEISMYNSFCMHRTNGGFTSDGMYNETSSG